MMTLPVPVFGSKVIVTVATKVIAHSSIDLGLDIPQCHSHIQLRAGILHRFQGYLMH